MKIPITIAVLILIVGFILAWREEQRLFLVHHVQQTLLAEADRLGISIDSARPSDRTRTSNRPLADKEAHAHKVAADHIAYLREMEALHQQGLSPDSAKRVRELENMDRILSMDAAQMAIVVAQIHACDDLKERMRQFRIGLYISALATNHPEAALNLFDEYREFLKGGIDQQFIGPSLNGWAKRDPLSALEWFRKNGGEYPEELADTAKQALALGSAATDPKLGFQLLGGLNPGDKASSISGIFDIPTTSAQRTEYFTAFRDYLAKLPDENSCKEAAEDVYSGLTHDVLSEGFAPAMKWLADTKLTPSELASFAQALGNTLGYMDLDVNRGQWIEWAAVNVPSDQSNDLVHRMVYYWTTEDFQAAGEWLNAAVDGPTKHRAIRTYAMTISPYQPEAAAQWAVTLPPGPARQNTLKHIHHNWPHTDAAGKAAATAFAIEHGIQ